MIFEKEVQPIPLPIVAEYGCFGANFFSSITLAKFYIDD